MFFFSSACTDAIRVMSYMAKNRGERVTADVIAKALDIALPYLAKTLKKLVAKEMLSSKRGVGGGVLLKRLPSEIKLLEIIIAIDGERPFDTCVMGLGECSSETPCVLHDSWQAQINEFRELLNATSLADV